MPPDLTFTTPAECRAYAAECDRIAAMLAIESGQSKLQALAADWRKIADDIESKARR